MSIGIKCGDRLAVVEDIDIAMENIAGHYGCKPTELTCGAAEKGRKGEMRVRVWKGRFNSSAGTMFIPKQIADEIQAKLKGKQS